MRLHDRHLLREMLGPLLIGLSLCVMMMTLQELYKLLQPQGPAVHQPLNLMGRYLLLKLPLMVQWSLPVGLLLGSCLALSRLQHDSELTAIRIAGVPTWRFLMPIIMVGVVFSVACRILGEDIVPPTNHQAEAIHRQLDFQNEVAGLSRHTFFRSDNRIFYFRNPTPAGQGRTLLQGIVVYQLSESAATADQTGRTPNHGAELLWTAEQGEVDGQIWTLFRPREYTLNADGEITGARDLPVLRFDLHRNIQFFLMNQETPQEMNAKELGARIAEEERLSVPASVILPMRYERAFRLALPFACVVFALVAPPLTLRFSRGGSLLGILIAFGVLFFYYDVMVIAQKLSLTGAVSPEFAAWIANISFGGLGIFLMLHEL